MIEVFLNASSIVATARADLWIAPVLTVFPDNLPYGSLYIVPIGGRLEVPKSMLPARVGYEYRDGQTPDEPTVHIACGVDVNMDGDCGTDADIAAYFAAYASSDDGLPSMADWNDDGSVDWTDISAFFASLGGG